MTSSGLVISASYDYHLVVLSILISMLGAWAALELAGRVAAARGGARLAWLIGGATASGLGTWSMHFTGMMAFCLPLPVEYDWPTALVSLLPAVFASAVAILIVSRGRTDFLRALAGGVLMGGGIAGMHYTAMASMRLPAMCHYSVGLAIVSVVLPMPLCLAALRFKFLVPAGTPGRRWSKAASALLMGAANPVMHYAGMAATTFTQSATAPDLSHAVPISLIGIEGVTIVPIMVLAVALVTSLVDRLQKESVLLDQLFEQGPLAVALTDADNRVIRVNSEFQRVFGYTPQEAVGRRLDELIVPDESREEFRQHTEPMLAHGHRVEAEGVRQRKDGSRLHVSAVRLPVSLPGGQRAVLAVFRDITPRKRAEDALRHSEEHLRLVIDTVPAFIHTGRPDGYLDFFNRRWLDYVGLPLEEVSGWKWTALNHPEDVAAMVEKWRTAVATGEPFEHESRLRRADGEYRWMFHRKVPLRDERGHIVKWYGSSLDIEDRKRAEEALQRSEAYLAAAQSLSHTGSWALILPSGELFWSQETYRIFGFDPARTTASINETFLPRLHPEDRPNIEQGIKTAANQRGSYAVDYRIILPDGSIKQIHDVVYTVTNEAGDIAERYGVVMDITERKRAEEALQRSRDQLRALTARLQSVREEERIRVAREIHDELGQALTAIKFGLSSLVPTLTGDEQQRTERIDSLLKLTDQTIQMVRKIATNLRPRILDELGLPPALEWAAEEFETRTGIKCRLDLPEDPIRVDQERATALFRIFQEALTNVARHANATEVQARLAREAAGLTLAVHDNGRGTDDRQLSGPQSLGILGMQERALILGGEFNITSEPGKGTTVKVHIPEARQKPPQENQ